MLMLHVRTKRQHVRIKYIGYLFSKTFNLISLKMIYI